MIPNLVDAFVGETQILKIYAGTNLVWEKSTGIPVEITGRGVSSILYVVIDGKTYTGEASLIVKTGDTIKCSISRNVSNGGVYLNGSRVTRPGTDYNFVVPNDCKTVGIKFTSLSGTSARIDITTT